MFLGCFCTYVGESHNHIGWAASMPFALINSINPRTKPLNFLKFFLRIGDFEKWPFWKTATLKNGHFEKRPFWKTAMLHSVCLFLHMRERQKDEIETFYLHIFCLISRIDTQKPLSTRRPRKEVFEWRFLILDKKAFFWFLNTKKQSWIISFISNL